MDAGPLLLDTDTLSELGRGHPRVHRNASAYLASFGRLTTTAITVFERLRGYRLAIREGRPHQRQLRAFEALAATCIVLPFDDAAAAVAAARWSAISRAQRRRLGDIMIAAVAITRRLPLVTRNRRDFEHLSAAAGAPLVLADWTRGHRRLTARPGRRAGGRRAGRRSAGRT